MYDWKVLSYITCVLMSKEEKPTNDEEYINIMFGRVTNPPTNVRNLPYLGHVLWVPPSIMLILSFRIKRNMFLIAS